MPISTRWSTISPGAAYGSAGERCMALPVVVPVGDETAEALKAELIPAIEKLRVGISTDNDVPLRPCRDGGAQGEHRALDHQCEAEGGRDR